MNVKKEINNIYNAIIFTKEKHVSDCIVNQSNKVDNNLILRNQSY